MDLLLSKLSTHTTRITRITRTTRENGNQTPQQPPILHIRAQRYDTHGIFALVGFLRTIPP